MRGMKPLIPVIASALLLAACGSAHKAAAHHAPKAAPALSAAQGARICSDVAAWEPRAERQDNPRFTARLTADTARALAGRSRLGTDLEGLGSDLLAENGVALMPGAPGQPQNIQLVRSDCEGYGVTVPQG